MQIIRPSAGVSRRCHGKDLFNTYDFFYSLVGAFDLSAYLATRIFVKTRIFILFLFLAVISLCVVFAFGGITLMVAGNKNTSPML